MRSRLSVLLYIMCLFLFEEILSLYWWLLLVWFGVVFLNLYCLGFIEPYIEFSSDCFYVCSPALTPFLRLQSHVHVFLAFFTSMFQRWLFFLRFSLGSLIFFFCGAYLLLGFQWSLHVTYSIFQLHNYYLVLFFILYVSLSLFQSFYFLIL